MDKEPMKATQLFSWASLASSRRTLFFETVRATLAIPVPIWPAPTTPTDFT